VLQRAAWEGTCVVEHGWAWLGLGATPTGGIRATRGEQRWCRLGKGWR
jgi:hypothetical protein